MLQTGNSGDGCDFGFRAGKGTVDAIFVVRQILEKAREHNVNLHLNLIDFKAAFDTICREALWKILAHVGIPQKNGSVYRENVEGYKMHSTNRRSTNRFISSKSLR